MSVLALFVLFFIFLLCVLLTTIHPPSQDLRGLKLSMLRNFHYLKIWTKPLYFVMDILWQLLELSGPPQRTVSHPFKISLCLFYLCYALTLVIQFYLLYTFFKDICNGYSLVCRSGPSWPAYQAVTYTEWYIPVDVLIQFDSPDDEHWVTRNM